MFNEKIYITWTELKTIIDSKKLSIQYKEEEYKYIIFSIDEIITYVTEIWKDDTKVDGIDTTQNALDKTDFETNYKDDANQSIIKNAYKDGKGIKIVGKSTVTDVDQIILEYTVPENTTIYITDIIVGGEIQDLKVLKKDNTGVWRAYHQAYDSIPHPFTTPIKMSAGKVITVLNKDATTGKHIATIIGVKINE